MTIEILILCILGVFLTYVLGKKYINIIKDKVQQPLLDVGPDHAQKVGTPTMGGIVFYITYLLLLVCLIIVFLVNNISLNGWSIAVLLVLTLGHFLLGFQDDFLKVTKQENTLGLSAKQKVIGQLILSLAIVLYVAFVSKDTTLYFGNIHFNIGLLYYLFIPFLVIATTNATNLTDGVDGLLTSNMIVTLSVLSVIAFSQSNYFILASNLIMISCLLGFLILNFNPAKVFMGDVGSLTLGAYLIYVVIMLKVELLFVFFGAIYFMETVSVILQVLYYRKTKDENGDGKRIWRMVPIHHHFEILGLKEKSVVALFVAINLVFSIIGLGMYYVDFKLCVVGLVLYLILLVISWVKRER